MKKVASFFSLLISLIFNTISTPILVAAASLSYCGAEVPGTSVPFTQIGKLAANLLVIATIGGSILLFIYLIMGGLQWLTSGGDQKATSAARDRITSAVTGLLIILAVWGIFRILEAALGISLLSGIKVPGAPTRPGIPAGCPTT